MAHSFRNRRRCKFSRVLQRVGLVLLAALLSAPALSAAAPAGAGLQAVVDGAKKEGTLKLYAPSTLGPKGAQLLQEGIKKKYGVDVNITYTSSGSMTLDVSKVVTEMAAGSRPTWDTMLVTDAHYIPLVQNDFLEHVDYGALGIDPKAVLYDGAAVAFATQFVAPAYNTKLVKPADLPKKWEDLLDPKWKGKIGINTATHHWGRLAQVWGDEKTTKYVRAMAEQKIVRGRLPEVYTRLQLGEVAIAATMTDSYVDEAKEKGAPIGFIEAVDPIIATHYLAAPLKGAEHRNAALLLVTFLVTPEGQAIWGKTQGQTSMFIKGSPAYNYVQKKNAVSLEKKFALSQFEDLTNKYGKLLGFR